MTHEAPYEGQIIQMALIHAWHRALRVSPSCPPTAEMDGATFPVRACLRVAVQVFLVAVQAGLVAGVALQELELGTVLHAVSAAPGIAVVILLTFAAFASSELPVLHSIRPPRTLEVIRAMVVLIVRLSASP